MKFDEFIQRCRAEWPEFGDPERLAKSVHPATRDLAGVLKQVPGMATENKLKLLNIAVASMDQDEVYVEVGCYKGASLVGAAAGNPSRRMFACDNFSQFDGAAAALRATLDAHTAPGQVAFFDMDFRELMTLAPWSPAKIGAYFYDGGHSFVDQYDGLRHAIRHLSRDALVIVDDTNKREARSADALIARQVPGFELVLDLRTPRNHHPTWWNGIQVFRVRKQRHMNPEDFGGTGFLARKLIYDDVLLNLKHRRRALRRSVKEWIGRRRSA